MYLVASLSNSEDFNPTLLFISKEELYIGNGAETYSFLTGEKMAYIIEGYLLISRYKGVSWTTELH